MPTTVRVHELAKELNLSSKDTIALLSKVGISASTHMSVIDQHRAQIVKGVLLGNLAKAAKSHKPLPKQAAGNGAKAPAKTEETSKAAPVQAVAPQAPPQAPLEGPAIEHAPVELLKPVASTTRQARPPAAHKVVPAASASPSTPVPSAARPAIAPRQERPPARPFIAQPRQGAAGALPLRSAPRGNGPLTRPMPGRPGMGPTSAPSPTSGPAPSGRKRSREELERDRKERQREELLKKSAPRHKARPRRGDGRTDGSQGSRDPRPAHRPAARVGDERPRGSGHRTAHQDGHDGHHQPTRAFRCRVTSRTPVWIQRDRQRSRRRRRSRSSSKPIRRVR